MDHVTREQIAHLEIERSNLESIRDRAISDLQRGVVAAAYAGADVEPIDLSGIREGLNEYFGEFIGPVSRREGMLRAGIGLPETLRVAGAGRAAKLRDAKEWHRKLSDALRHANHSAEDALIRAYEAAYPGVFEAPMSEAAE
ncbi:hypothetical protein [Xanthobacter autotrophicus]|uniref:hypothetical protein n=1 Tax=Xanthobacter autotrophicus TaxID=280 RepID=UPI00372A46A3